MPALFNMGFSVRKPAWHGLATVLDDYPGRDEAMRIAGHNWVVVEQPLFMAGGAKVEGWKALVRHDTLGLLSVVRESYEPVQNVILWDIVDAIVKQPNVKYETAGVLRDGCTLWVMARLDEPWQVPGDDTLTMPYVAVGTSHDAQHATEAMPMAVRVVCWNTYQAARESAKRAGTYFSFRHTSNVDERIKQARDAMSMVRAQFGEFKELALELANHPVTQDGVTAFIEQFIPMPAVGKVTSKAESFVDQARSSFAALLGGVTVPEAHRRTAYGLWCAGVEFLDHVRAFRTNETYFRRTTEPNVMKHKLAKLALTV